MYRIPALLLVCLLSAAARAGAQTVAVAESWSTPTPPLRIIDNIYYVGTVDLASYLVTTPAGHILIDTGLEQNAEPIAAGITALGFKPGDVRIILTTQAHFDHVGALARIKTITGARVLVSAGDAPLVEAGGKGDYLFGPQYYFPPTKVDAIVRDGEPVRLGGVELMPHLTPGHTPGDTTWTTTARDEAGTLRNVVFAGSTSVNPGTRLVANDRYPRIADDYRHAFAVLKSLPCDVFLAAHASAYDGPAKMARARADERPNPFIDPGGFKDAIARSERAFLEELNKQESK
jgi:metallo-beta-lactamase class B